MFKKLLMAVLLVAVSVSAYAGSKWNNNNTEPIFNARTQVTKTADYTATFSDDLIKVTTSTADVTITLPAISTFATNGFGSKGYKILKTDATKYSVLIAPNGSDTIDGTTGYAMVNQNDFVVLSATSGGQADWKIGYSDDALDTDVTTGAVTIGGTMQTRNAVTFSINDDGTAAVVDVITIEKTTTGTAASGLGAGISFNIEDLGGSEQQASIDVVLTTETDGSEDADIVFSQNLAGAIEERVRFDADGNTILLTGTLPKMTIGDSGAEDTTFIMTTNAQNFYIGGDDSADDLVIGVGTAVGTTPALMIDEDQEVSIIKRKHFLDADNVTLVLADCGSVRMIATDAKTYTLPNTATVSAGCEFTFVNTGADDAVLLTVTPDDAVADGIYGTCAAVRMTGSDDGDLTNPKTGANRGDWVKIISDGVDGWYIIGCDGIWAGA